MSNRCQKTVISKSYKSVGADGKLRTYQKTEEIAIGGKTTSITTTTEGARVRDCGRHQEIQWRSLSPASGLTEEVLPRSESSSSFDDRALYGDDWSSMASDLTDLTVIQEAQLMKQMKFFSPFSAESYNGEDRAPSSASNAPSGGERVRPASSNVPSRGERAPSASSNASSALKMHNDYRALHGAPSLVLDDSLNAYAQEWAQHLAAIGTLQHRPAQSRKCGENIFCGMNIPPEEAVKSWYNEYPNYNFNRPGFASNTGHFTQVVWKESSRLGIGVARANNTVYVVANYDPPGNFNGADNYRRNVSPKN
uniref:SCP domain-containing protein n=1 Tax=Plectus sambesii TaxID=2011161 RepID=A0A914UJL3_9BILA